MKGSWRMSLVGLFTGLSMLLLQGVAVLDNDPATVLDFQSMSIAVGAIGIAINGLLGREERVSSEDVGVARPKP